METRTLIDKSTWPDGPWIKEPDLGAWTTQGVPCLVLRVPNLGTLSGYVGISPAHPFTTTDATFEDIVELTFAGCVSDLLGDMAFILFPDFGGWSWLGFDCAHAWDLIPLHSMAGPISGLEQTYRDWPYVIKVVEDMASRIAKGRT